MTAATGSLRLINSVMHFNISPGSRRVAGFLYFLSISVVGAFLVLLIVFVAFEEQRVDTYLKEASLPLLGRVGTCRVSRG